MKPADVLCRGRVGGSLEKRSEPLAAVNMAPLRARTELARIHVLDHTLAQRADGFRTHRRFLSWMRLTTPRSSRQGTRPLSTISTLATVLAARCQICPGLCLSNKPRCL